MKQKKLFAVVATGSRHLEECRPRYSTAGADSHSSKEINAFALLSPSSLPALDQQAGFVPEVFTHRSWQRKVYRYSQKTTFCSPVSE